MPLARANAPRPEHRRLRLAAVATAAVLSLGAVPRRRPSPAATAPRRHRVRLVRRAVRRARART